MNIINLERKKEYTTILINILSPILYEGILSIYIDGIKNCSSGSELKIFQSLLKSIPDWDQNLLQNEVNRIKIASNCNYLDDLIKCVIKVNILILMNNEFDEELYNININHFIHNCYKTIAKDFYQNPELLYHNNKPLDIKKNQRISIDLIKNSIKNTILKMLPINILLESFLNEDILQKKDNNLVINQQYIEKNIEHNEEIINDTNNNLEGGNINSDNKINNNSYTNTHSSSRSAKSLKNNDYRLSYNNSVSNSVSNSASNSKISPSLVSDKILEKAQSNLKNNSTNTNSIINNLKSNRVLSSVKISDNINTIKESNNELINDTSISYNIDNHDGEYLTVFNNN